MATAHQKECKQDIYSSLNYEEQRKRNLNQIQELYQKLMDQYSSVYQTYLNSNQDALADPTSPEAQNESDRNQVELKPKIKNLNQEIIKIEEEVLKNNKDVRKDIEEQQRQLKKEDAQKKILNKKLDKIEDMIQHAETKGQTGTESVKDLQKQTATMTYWYYGLLFITAVLFVLFVYSFWQVL